MNGLGTLFSHGNNLGQGEAILIPNTIIPRLNISQVEKDSEGRYILFECEIDENCLVIVHVCVLTKDQIDLQIQFMKLLKDYLEKYSDKNLIIRGDFNICLNYSLDTRGGKKENTSKCTNSINSLIEEYNLSNIWRMRNPRELKFTRRENSRAGLVQSRLDYFLISIQLSYNISNSTIKPGLKSDQKFN